MKQHYLRLFSTFALSLAVTGAVGVASAAVASPAGVQLSGPTAQSTASRAAAQMRAVAGRAHGAVTSTASRAYAQILQLRRGNASAATIAAAYDTAIARIDEITADALDEIEEISDTANARIDDLDGSEALHTLVNNAAHAATERVNTRQQWAHDRVQQAMDRPIPGH